MADVSKLLRGNAAAVSFLSSLEIDDDDRAKLKRAQTQVRAHLRRVFAGLSKERLGMSVSPRFYTQGSFKYKTINDPAWTPPQQMDLDDGCYLPMTFVRGERPSKAAAAFFEIVDAALEELAEEKGWRFARKPTCARVIVAHDAHVDVPLYAIPDHEFVTLEKAHESRSVALDSALSTRIDSWDQLPTGCVLLAHREDDWIYSDPRLLADWFKAEIDIFGEKLRRTCRYLKAWRDHNRPALDSVSSILLMACVDRAFQEIGRRNLPEREDKLLLAVLERLPDCLSGEVTNPVNPDERLDRRLSDADRRVAITMVQQFCEGLRTTIETCIDADEAISSLRSFLGPRVPNDASLVSISEAARAEVRRHPPKIVSAPTVGRSLSG